MLLSIAKDETALKEHIVHRNIFLRVLAAL